MKNINSLFIISLLCIGFACSGKSQEVVTINEKIEAPEMPKEIIEANTIEQNIIQQIHQIPEEIEQVEQNVKTEEILPQAIEPESVEIPQNNKISSITEKNITYTWADFVAGKHCSSKDTFATETKEISNLIFSYCNYPKTDAWQKWLNTFRTAKKDYLVQQDMKEKNSFIKYLKVIPHLLFEVHNTQATGQDFSAQLNQIESAILKRETNQAIDLIQNIQNDSLKLAMQPVLTEGKNLLKIKEELTQTPMEAKND